MEIVGITAGDRFDGITCNDDQRGLVAGNIMTRKRDLRKRDRRDYLKKYHAEHKAEEKVYRENRKEHIKERNKKYKENHRIETREYNKKWSTNHRDIQRESSRQYKKKYPESIKAMNKLRNVVRFRKLKRPTVCSECGIICKIEAHHPDHSKPLEVEWLCHLCHSSRMETICRRR